MPNNKQKREKIAAIAKNIKDLLQTLGLDTTHQELRGTPLRTAKMFYEEILQPYPRKKLFQVSTYPYKSMVCVRNHVSWSRCPHHLERVKIIASVAYIPDGRVLGASKLPRIVDYYAKGLMLQEEITDSIADALMNALRPKGVAVVLRGEHMCMKARGVKSICSDMTTARLTGVFMDDEKARDEFYQLIGGCHVGS